MEKRGVIKSHIIAGILTITVISLLIIIGPAQAFIVNMTIPNPIVLIGDAVSFIISASTEEGDNILSALFFLNITGPQNASCRFNVNGTPVSSCPGFSIVKLEGSDDIFGYGYGYLTGNFKYNVTIDSGTLVPGRYNAEFIAHFDNSTERSSAEFNVVNNSLEIEGCSIRGEDGKLLVNNTAFGKKNKLNFNIPKKNAAKGKGSFTSQDKGERISYKFNILDTTEFDDRLITADISGRFRNQDKETTNEEARIIVDKLANKISIIGDSFTLEDMDARIIKKC